MDNGTKVLPSNKHLESSRIRNPTVWVTAGCQAVSVNLAGWQAGDVFFHAAVTAAAGHIHRQTSKDPPKYLVKLVFSFRGVSEVPEDRIAAA
jgi:hypothetical protein